MVSGDGFELTEDEAELYDRQIRLWGVESQRKLRNARILIVGLGGFGAEITKNIILSGVKSVTLLDALNVTVEDSMAQFLIPPDSVGQNRAEASLKRAQALNPMVKVIAEKGDVNQKQDEYFVDFDVVVATSCNLAQIKRINTSCRMNNIKFFCGDVLGMFGFAFADLLIHEYGEEVISQAIQGNKPEKKTVLKTKTYIPLADALEVDVSLLTPRRISKLDYSFFLMLTLFKFRKLQGRKPDRKKREEDIKTLRDIANGVLIENNLPKEKIPDSALGKLFGEVSAVCAITGGVVAQEIIKTVSQKDAPLDQFFFFNPETYAGFMESFNT